MDTDKTEKIHPNYWLNSHLSIARYYGRVMINGVEYVLDDDDYLVRIDIYKKEYKKTSKKLNKAHYKNQFQLFEER